MKNKPKVFIDTYYYKAAPAGIRTYIKELVNSALIHGSSNYIISHDLNKSSSNLKFLNSKSRAIRWLFQFKYLLWKQVFLPIKLKKCGADILICPDYVLPFWKLKAKKIVIIHDSLFWDYPLNYSNLWRKYYLKLIKLGINDSTIIATTSNYSKNNLIRIFPNINISVVYQSFEKSNNLLKSKKYDNKKLLLHVGSFEKRKNILFLVRAFKEFKKNIINKDFKLVLAGTTNFFGNSDEYNRIINFLDENNLNEEVIIPGYLIDSEIIKLYNQSMLYVFPSLEEGFGIPILESFNYGLPVICSNIKVFQEIGSGAVLQFDINDIKDLSLKIESLANNKNLREKLINKGFERVKLFSRLNFIKSMEELF